MATETLAQASRCTRDPGQRDTRRLRQADAVQVVERAGVVNRIVEGANWFALCVNEGAAPDPDPTHGVDYAAGACSPRMTGASPRLSPPSARRRSGADHQAPLRRAPWSGVHGHRHHDVFTHGWDLAKATGQPTDLDPEMAEDLHAQVQGFVNDAFRGPDGEAPFGPEVAAPPSASAADRARPRSSANGLAAAGFAHSPILRLVTAAVGLLAIVGQRTRRRRPAARHRPVPRVCPRTPGMCRALRPDRRPDGPVRAPRRMGWTRRGS